MKGLITAGGRGTRLRPITFTINKHTIPIANKPMILYPLESMVKIGIKEIGVIVNETKPEIEAILGNGGRWGVKIKYIFQEQPLGLAHCLKISQDFLKKDKFIFYLGDNIFTGDLASIAKKFIKSNDSCHLLLVEVDDPSRFGQAIVKNGRVIKTVEKPPKPISKWAIAGIYFLDHHCFESFKGREAIKPSARGELEIPDVFQYLIDHKFRVTAENVTGWWKDTGRMEDLLEANRLILDAFNGRKILGKSINSTFIGDVKVGKKSLIKNSIIRGPVVIGEKVIIKDSYIGPYTSVYHSCLIENSEVENSILLENAAIKNITRRIDSSLIGKESIVQTNSQKPKILKFLIGDSSLVSLD